MAQPGDPASRPEEGFVFATNTRDMDRELARLTSSAVLVWLGRDRPEVGVDVIERAFCTQFAIPQGDLTVAKHHPEDFIVDFKHRHHRDAAVELRDFPFGNLDIRIRPWQLPTHGNHVDLRYHARLCMEGVPLHAWNESICNKLVSGYAGLHYVEEPLRKEDTRTINTWTWIKNPSSIPKVSWLTLSDRAVEVHDGYAAPSGSSRGRRSLCFRVIVHLDLLEDPPGRDGRSPPPKDYKWHYGIIDGERTPRSRHDPRPVDRYDGRRREDDDDDDLDRRGRRSRKDDSWSSRLFRSLSRAPR
ncbi:hypothetical protein C2845_PM09G13460 [Panicum miliaceum]|uniref:DUF4283 domain-containing protein n=1 Tax=Panicum miliaceum TaxID=4540 RepID=A0A3L6S126_PANMI|nr:hypothetical protein C2845_PM09G13460 [Panicum miliaceum]